MPEEDPYAEANQEPFIIPGNTPRPKPVEVHLERCTIRDSALPHVVAPTQTQPQISAGNGSPPGSAGP
ncbi:MAG: hypothetical protein JOZ42_06275 [Acetobacteraceae bacterium]|nr:hypothetical protein [Acetobacteraceae bacterium]